MASWQPYRRQAGEERGAGREPRGATQPTDGARCVVEAPNGRLRVGGHVRYDAGHRGGAGCQKGTTGSWILDRAEER